MDHSLCFFFIRHFCSNFSQAIFFCIAIILYLFFTFLRAHAEGELTLLSAKTSCEGPDGRPLPLE